MTGYGELQLRPVHPDGTQAVASGTSSPCSATRTYLPKRLPGAQLGCPAIEYREQVTALVGAVASNEKVVHPPRESTSRGNYVSVGPRTRPTVIM